MSLMRSSILAMLLLVAGSVAGPAQAASHSEESRLARQVRKELVTLPFYGVFDNFAFRIEGSKVTLLGQVTRPTLKKAAERVTKNVEGVTEVVNEIEVLPVSSTDDRIRIAVYRTIYNNPNFTRYAIRAVPPIHIIVNNGDVTLEGVVAAQTDKDLANLLANGVAGVFSVTNNLRVENE